MDLTSITAASAAGATLTATVLSALRSDNTILRSHTSTRTRVFVAIGLGIAYLVLLTLAKQPVDEAAISALAGTLSGIVASAAPREVAGLVLCFFLASTSACSAFTPKRINAVVKITECVLAHRSQSPDQVAIICGLENAQEVVDIITGEDRRMSAARAIGEQDGRALGCKR